MHRGKNLGGLLSRVERLSQELRQAACGGNHVDISILHVMPGESEPPWPKGPAPTCACGEPIIMRRIVHCHLPAL